MICLKFYIGIKSGYMDLSSFSLLEHLVSDNLSYYCTFPELIGKEKCYKKVFKEIDVDNEREKNIGREDMNGRKRQNILLGTKT